MKSIFDYMTMPIQNATTTTTPTTTQFLNTIPSVVPKTNIDIENDLRNATRRNTKCVCGKYHPQTLKQ
jgi:hypothetical protein